MNNILSGDVKCCYGCGNCVRSLSVPAVTISSRGGRGVYR